MVDSGCEGLQEREELQFWGRRYETGYSEYMEWYSLVQEIL